VAPRAVYCLIEGREVAVGGARAAPEGLRLPMQVVRVS
jgi:hypothetical protein